MVVISQNTQNNMSTPPYNLREDTPLWDNVQIQSSGPNKNKKKIKKQKYTPPTTLTSTTPIVAVRQQWNPDHMFLPESRNPTLPYRLGLQAFFQMHEQCTLRLCTTRGWPDSKILQHRQQDAGDLLRCNVTPAGQTNWKRRLSPLLALNCTLWRSRWRGEHCTNCYPS